MKFFRFGYALNVGAVMILLAGCAGSQASIPAQTAAAARGLTSPAYEVLHRFGRYHNQLRNIGGANPRGGLLNVAGVLYGTTENGGGKAEAGTVFSISPNGQEKTIYRFLGGTADGSDPGGDLIDVNGTLYGTTNSGGTCGNGTVFSVTTSGAETVLHSFCGTDGIGPPGASPLVNLNGTLYGTTFQGGASGSNGWGTVYSISTSGGFKVLHAFIKCEGSGTQYPCGLETGLVYVNGVFYGTSVYGGTGCYGNGGCGTVYSVTKTGKMKLLYSFQGGSDGSFPVSTLINVNGTLYGTTLLAGDPGCENSLGCGTIYSITTGGTEQVLYHFTGGSDGGNPTAPLLAINGTLYGTALFGGASNDGTAYSFSTSGGEQTLHTFGGGSDGANPAANVIDLDGILYGTTHNGGRAKPCGGDGCGTVFALSL